MDNEKTLKYQKNFKSENFGMFYKTVVKTWKPSSQVWAFKHGDDLITGIASLSSGFITHALRKELKIRPHARLTCYTPVVGLSAIGSIVSQNRISGDVIASDSCPLCILTKAAIIQLCFGLGYPLIIAPIVNFYLADRLITYPVPSLTQAPKEALQLYLKIMQKYSRQLGISAVAQIFFSTLVTQQKMNFMHHLWSNV